MQHVLNNMFTYGTRPIYIFQQFTLADRWASWHGEQNMSLEVGYRYSRSCTKSSLCRSCTKFATVCRVEWNVYAAAFTPPKWCNCAYGFCRHESPLTKFWNLYKKFTLVSLCLTKMHEKFHILLREILVLI